MEMTIANLPVQPFREPVIDINSAENAVAPGSVYGCRTGIDVVVQRVVHIGAQMSHVRESARRPLTPTISEW